MPNKSELKACPFCGGEAEVNKDYHFGKIKCTKCCATTVQHYYSLKKAIRIWNTRVLVTIDEGEIMKVLAESVKACGGYELYDMAKALSLRFGKDTGKKPVRLFKQS